MPSGPQYSAKGPNAVMMEVFGEGQLDSYRALFMQCIAFATVSHLHEACTICHVGIAYENEY